MKLARGEPHRVVRRWNTVSNPWRRLRCSCGLKIAAQTTEIRDTLFRQHVLDARQSRAGV